MRGIHLYLAVLITLAWKIMAPITALSCAGDSPNFGHAESLFAMKIFTKKNYFVFTSNLGLRQTVYFDLGGDYVE